jgi:hypothetical protein
MMQTREEFARCQRGMLGPAWRCKAALEITNVSYLNLAQMWDPLTIAAAKYFALRSDGVEGLERAAAAYPKIDAAIALHDDVAKTDVIKLLVLAEVPVDAIAQRVGGDPEVVATWEGLFFEVRGMGSATSWLSVHVVDQERQAGNTALAARMKLALVAGVEGANAVLAMDQGAPLDEAERLFQRKLKLNLKFDEAAAMPIDSERGRLTFIKLYVHLQTSERQLELAGKKLAARCAQARDRHELAKLRIDYAQERAVMNAHEKHKKAQRRHEAQEVRNAAATSAQELQHHARSAEQKAAACRAAQSPLARLTWGIPKPNPVTIPAALLHDIEMRAELTERTADWAQEFDTAADPYEAGRLTGVEELEIAISGGV